MINSSKTKLTLLVLMSIMLNFAFADYKTVNIMIPCAPGSADCYQIFSHLDLTPQGFRLIAPANQVRDCYQYLSNGQCTCGSIIQPFYPMEIAMDGGVKFGCVPPAERKINGLCAYITPPPGGARLQYYCTCSAADYTNQVTMMTGSSNNNPDSISIGCSKYTSSQVPCYKWKIKTSATPDLDLLPGDSDNDGWTLECGQCPGNALVEFATSPIQPISNACIVNTGPQQGFLLYCLIYTYAANFADIQCNACFIGTYAKIQTDTGSTPICTTGTLPTNCQKYFSSSPVSDTTAPSCYQCKAGYDKTSTEIGLTIFGAPIISTAGTCSQSATVIPNPPVIRNPPVTPNTPVTPSTPVVEPAYCSNSVTSAGQKLCLSCKKGYTILYSTTGALPVCVPSVEKCHSLSATGCSSCVAGYQLINNACLDLPPNCEKIDDKSVCIQCKSGFATDSDSKCVRTNANTCPAGQVPSNGVCVPVQVTIADCVSYTTESKCDRCVEGKIPSGDGLSCVVVRTNTDRPGAKPCSPNTSSITYRRNPSEPLGDCVAMDVQCAGSRDDGFCFSCKNGEYAHSDGKCYKVTITDERN